MYRLGAAGILINSHGRKLSETGIPQDRIREHVNHSVFDIRNIKICMTGAFHPHQLGNPIRHNYWHFTTEDCTGFRPETQDGIIWTLGDTMLMEEHLNNTDADLVMIDFSVNEHYFGRRFSVQLANALHHSQLIMFHWGTVYSPHQDCYNADPNDIKPHIISPEHLHIMVPGEKYILHRHASSNRI